MEVFKTNKVWHLYINYLYLIKQCLGPMFINYGYSSQCFLLCGLEKYE